MTAKEKMTAPIASVSADVEQPSSNKLTNQSIADLLGKGNLQATNNAENTEKSANKKNPDDLETVSMMELYDTAYPPKLPIIDGLLYNGVYLFVGSPKIGKSFFMAQIGYHISKGLPLWGFLVRQGTVLYVGSENIVTIVTTVTERRNMERKSQVQIPKDLLLALFQYHLAGNEEYQPEIEKALMEKLDSMVKRQLYTTFKTAPTEEEREKARQEYLDKCGMHKDFRG